MSSASGVSFSLGYFSFGQAKEKYLALRRRVKALRSDGRVQKCAEAIPAFAGMTMGADAIFVGMTILEGLQAFARASKGIAHKVRSYMCASH